MSPKSRPPVSTATNSMPISDRQFSSNIQITSKQRTRIIRCLVPARLAVPSSRSRVVPANGLTIDPRFRVPLPPAPTSRLNNDDFPTLGLPTIGMMARLGSCNEGADEASRIELRVQIHLEMPLESSILCMFLTSLQQRYRGRAGLNGERCWTMYNTNSPRK